MKRSRAYRRFRYFIKKRWAEQIWKISSMLLKDNQIAHEEKHGHNVLIGKLASSPKHIKHDLEEEKIHYQRAKEKEYMNKILKEAI